MKEKILKLLEGNSKLSSDKISEMLDIPPDKVEKVIKVLEKDHVIAKYCTLVDWDKTDRDIVHALIEVRVTPERGLGFDAVAKRIYNFSDVSSVFLMSGSYDLSVRVEGRTMKEVALFVAERLATIDSVQSTVTHLILKTYKKDGVIFKKEDKLDERLVISP